MTENNFGKVVESLFQGLDGFASAKTVVGEPIMVKDAILLPLVDVSFGMGAGASMNDEKKKNSGGGGMGAKMTPNAILVIQNGTTRLVNIKNQDTITKILDMAPDLIARFKKKGSTDPMDPEVEAAAEEILKEAKKEV